MLRNYYINKEWILSGTAKYIYRIAALFSLALFFMLVAVKFVGTIPDALLPVAKPILLLGVLGAGITMVAMEYFLFGFDSSPAFKKVFWFCVMCLPPLGPALYCFVVYSRSTLLDDRGAGGTEERQQSLLPRI
jgi:hypothetical protein